VVAAEAGVEVDAAGWNGLEYVVVVAGVVAAAWLAGVLVVDAAAGVDVDAAGWKGLEYVLVAAGVVAADVVTTYVLAAAIEVVVTVTVLAAAVGVAFPDDCDWGPAMPLPNKSRNAEPPRRSVRVWRCGAAS
jgi:hypothetical protein